MPSRSATTSQTQSPTGTGPTLPRSQSALLNNNNTSTTSPPTPSTPTAATATTLSSPLPLQTFDILPTLHTLLSRLQPPHPSSSTTTTQTTTLPDAPPQFTLKDLPTEAHGLKIRIQKAKVAAGEIQDGNRSLEDLERELRVLEERREEVKGVLASLGERARTV